MNKLPKIYLDQETVESLPKPSVMTKFSGLTVNQVQHTYCGRTALSPRRAAELLIGEYAHNYKIRDEQNKWMIAEHGIYNSYDGYTDVLEDCVMFHFFRDKHRDKGMTNLYRKELIKSCLDICFDSDPSDFPENKRMILNFPIQILIESENHYLTSYTCISYKTDTL